MKRLAKRRPRFIDITLVLNGHREGAAALPTLGSATEAVGAAGVAGLQVEVLCVLDRPDAETRRIFGDFQKGGAERKVIEVDFGDLGLARNAGVAMARGRWVAYLDADDLVGRNWLVEAARCAADRTEDIVWHPEVNIIFGAAHGVLRHVDMEDPSTDLSGLALTNFWTALCFTSRDLLERVPYRAVNLAMQIGYEDWAWNMEIIAREGIHKVVPGTGHMIRHKSASLARATDAMQCLPVAKGAFLHLLGQMEDAKGVAEKTTKSHRP